MLDLEKAVTYCYSTDMQELLFTALNLLPNNKEVDRLKERLVIQMFIEALQREQMHFALRIQADFKSTIMEYSYEVLNHVMNCLLYSPFYMDVKLSILHEFLPKI